MQGQMSAARRIDVMNGPGREVKLEAAQAQIRPGSVGWNPQNFLEHQAMFMQGDAAGSRAATAVQRLASRRRQQRSRQADPPFNGSSFTGDPQGQTGPLIDL